MALHLISNIWRGVGERRGSRGNWLMEKIGLITYQMGVYCLLISTWTRKIKSLTKLTNTSERHIRIWKEISQANETWIVLFSYTSRHWIWITLVFGHQIVTVICLFLSKRSTSMERKIINIDTQGIPLSLRTIAACRISRDATVLLQWTIAT